MRSKIIAASAVVAVCGSITVLIVANSPEVVGWKETLSTIIMMWVLIYTTVRWVTAIIKWLWK